MALTICYYCNKTHLDGLSHCPHCSTEQMDMVLHAQLLTKELRAKKALQEKENTRHLADKIVLVPTGEDPQWKDLPLELIHEQRA